MLDVCEWGPKFHSVLCAMSRLGYVQYTCWLVRSRTKFAVCGAAILPQDEHAFACGGDVGHKPMSPIRVAPATVSRWLDS